jgi:hypothetical protein
MLISFKLWSFEATVVNSVVLFLNTLSGWYCPLPSPWVLPLLQRAWKLHHWQGVQKGGISESNGGGADFCMRGGGQMMGVLNASPVRKLPSKRQACWYAHMCYIMHRKHRLFLFFGVESFARTTHNVIVLLNRLNCTVHAYTCKRKQFTTECVKRRKAIKNRFAFNSSYVFKQCTWWCQEVWSCFFLRTACSTRWKKITMSTQGLCWPPLVLHASVVACTKGRRQKQ